MIRILARVACTSISLIPVAAFAAVPPALRAIDVLSFQWWITFIFVQVLILFAYVASSLAKWAKWVDGTRHDKLEVLQGVFASLLAGNIGWLLAYHYGKLDEALCWVSAAGASYGGDTYLTHKLRSMIGMERAEKLN